jgi:hypothetical protein
MRASIELEATRRRPRQRDALNSAATPFLQAGGKLDRVFQRRLDVLIDKKKEGTLTRDEAAELKKWLEIVDRESIRLLETAAPPPSRPNKGGRRSQSVARH